MSRWFLLLSLLLLPACYASPHYEATGRIGILCIGDTSYGESPILGWLSLDFAVQWQELPTDVGGVMTDEAAKKVTRIYLPRTLERMVQSYDILLLLEPRMNWFSGTEMHRFAQGVDEGLSAFLTLWPDDEGYLSLVETDFASVFPQDFTPFFEAAQDVPFVVEIVEERPPVLTPFLQVGIERFKGTKTRPIYPRQGSLTWAIARKSGLGAGNEDEFIISWEYGEKGAVNWVVGVDVDEGWFRPSGGNEYAADIILNMVYYSTGKELPPSIELIHGLRSAFYRYNLEKKLIFSMIEFVDRFGANTATLESAIAEADLGKVQAEGYYLEGDYDSSYATIREMIKELSALNSEAIKIKERALLWVYLTEWTAVSGTLVLAGFVLYSLMVQRKLYREVSVTRSS